MALDRLPAANDQRKAGFAGFARRHHCANASGSGQNSNHRAQQFIRAIKFAQHLGGLLARGHGKFPWGQIFREHCDEKGHPGRVELLEQLQARQLRHKPFGDRSVAYRFFLHHRDHLFHPLIHQT